MKNSFDEKILEEANDWIKANQKVVLATVGIKIEVDIYNSF